MILMSTKTTQIGVKTPTTPQATYVMRLGDNALILGQRLAEMCGHGPEMEIDMALTNFALDLIGQASLLYEHALSLEDMASNVDALAMTRNEEAYRNCLLVAQPNVDFAHIILRQYLFSTFQKRQYEALLNSSDKQLAAIAEKSLKEIAYHIRFAKSWVLRLGDGTEESHARLSDAVDCLWRFTGELFNLDDVVSAATECGLTEDFTDKYSAWQDEIGQTLGEAGGIKTPDTLNMLKGGQAGMHDENLGHILKDLQYMQIKYPNLQW